MLLIPSDENIRSGYCTPLGPTSDVASSPRKSSHRSVAVVGLRGLGLYDSGPYLTLTGDGLLRVCVEASDSVDAALAAFSRPGAASSTTCSTAAISLQGSPVMAFESIAAANGATAATATAAMTTPPPITAPSAVALRT